MCKRCLTTGLALVFLLPSLGGSQQIALQFQNAQVEGVANLFTSIAATSGRIITVAPDAANAKISGGVYKLEWREALDRLVEWNALVARDRGQRTIRIERRKPLTIEFENANLSDVVRSFATFAGRTIVVATEADDPAITASVRDMDWERALREVVATQRLTSRVDEQGTIRIERALR